MKSNTGQGGARRGSGEFFDNWIGVFYRWAYVSASCTIDTYTEGLIMEKQKLLNLLREGVTVEDLLNSTLDGIRLTSRKFSVKNDETSMSAKDLKVSFSLDGCSFNKLSKEALDSAIISFQRPLRNLSNAEIEKLLKGERLYVVPIVAAGTAIESSEERKARATANSAMMSDDEVAIELKRLQELMAARTEQKAKQEEE